MEFYLSFNELLERSGNPLILIFLPVLLVTTLLEGLLIMRRQGGYPWQNAGLSTGMAIGHLITQAATHGLTFGIIATSVYKLRLTTIPISFHHWSARRTWRTCWRACGSRPAKRHDRHPPPRRGFPKVRFSSIGITRRANREWRLPVESRCGAVAVG